MVSNGVWYGYGRYLGDRCEAVGGARCVGHDVSAPFLVLLVVDPHHVHGRVVLGRGRDKHLLRAACRKWKVYGEIHRAIRVSPNSVQHMF